LPAILNEPTNNPMRTIRLIFIILIELIIYSSVFAQNPDKSFANDTISKEDIKLFLEYLASDNLGGRAPGTNGFNLAANYVDSLFNVFGLMTITDTRTTYFQEFEVEKYSVETTSFITIETNHTIDTFYVGKNFIPFHFGKLNNERISGSVLFVNDGMNEPEYEIDDYLNLDIRGKWLLMNENISQERINKLSDELQIKYSDPHSSSIQRAKNAENNGALGILLISSKSGLEHWDIRESAFKYYHTIKQFNTPFRTAILPIILIDSLINTNLLNQTEIKFLNYDKIVNKEETIKTHNIIGTIAGANPELSNNYLVVGAHIDHIGSENDIVYNGADDNASGSAAVIELAKVISNNPLQHSCVFILFSSEEIGLLGSHYFINNTTIKKEQIQAMINLDMIGRSDASVDGIAPITINHNEYWKRQMNGLESEFKIRWDYADSFPRKNSGDHYPFYIKSIPTLFLFSGFHPDYHQPTDVSEKIDYEFLKSNTELVYRLLKVLDNE
jgi:hypothetical protein